MSKFMKSQLPAAAVGQRPSNLSGEFSPKLSNRWNAEIGITGDDQGNVINIYDVIGYDYWDGGGVTAQSISDQLKAFGTQADITVNINSPGGDVFEGLAIYNLLRLHQGNVTVRILGIAASAASYIAMAGDEVYIGEAAFIMIHNAWTFAAGDKNDLTAAAALLSKIDQTIADIISARSGMDNQEILQMMDVETYITAQESVDQGFADDFIPSDKLTSNSGTTNQKKSTIAARRLDSIMASQGIPRTERRAIIQDLKSGTQDAAHVNTPRATDNALQQGMNELKSLMQSMLNKTPA